MRWLTAIAFAGLMLGACLGGGEHAPATAPSPAATVAPRATPTQALPDDVAALPPRPAAEALSDESFARLHRYFVVDIDTGLVQPLGFGAAFSSSDPIGWLDDATLWLAHPDGAVALGLDGSVSEPRAMLPDRRERYYGGTSASGEWSAGQLGSGPGGVIVQQVVGQERRYRIANAMMGLWSPVRDVHLLAGNSCADLFVFDPQTAMLVNLTRADERLYRSGFVWAPDGVRIAAGARSPGADELVVIDTVAGTITTVARSASRADIRPIDWSPAGRHLLFYAWTTSDDTGCSWASGEETYLDTAPVIGERF